MENLYDLFHQVSDFIDNYIIVKSNSKLHITYVYKIYDLVDKDLDYDEEYYARIIKNLQNLVIAECKSRIESNPKITQVSIVIGKQLMKYEKHFETKIEITNDEIIFKQMRSK